MRHFLAGHDVETARERGWSTLANGALLAAAEAANYDVFVTTDSNLKHQQRMEGRRLAMIVLTTTSWPRIQRAVDAVVRAVAAATPRSYAEVAIP